MLEGNAEEIAGKHFEIRKVCDRQINDAQRASIRDFCTVRGWLGRVGGAGRGLVLVLRWRPPVGLLFFSGVLGGAGGTAVDGCRRWRVSQQPQANCPQPRLCHYPCCLSSLH